MMALLLVPLPPLLLALLLAGPAGLRAVAGRLAPWAAVPALFLAIQGPVEPQRISWLLFGSEFGLDGLGRALLAMTALLWTAAGVSTRTMLASDPHRVRYWVFHLLTLTGNLALLVAADVVGFYLGFALMTFAAYGLVVHKGTAAARRAGRIYLVMAVLGEGVLLAGLFLASAAADGALRLPEVAAAVAGAPHRDVVIALLVAGFGVKAGVLPLHVWLPLAHPVAPTPASAVLSGCMIKAGLLGWLRFLPIGEAALPDWGGLLVVAGLAAAFFGAVAGVAQDDAKTTLAYSSISQMGFLTIAVGIGLATPSAGPAAIAACAVYAAHHGMAKGALFLGAGVAAAAGTRRARRAVVLSLLLPALALAGAPMTSGALAKSALKEIEPFAPPLLLPLSSWLFAAAIATTLVLVRFLVLVSRQSSPERVGPAAGLWLSYTGLLSMVAALGLFGAGSFGFSESTTHSLADLSTAAGPILVGGLLAWLGARLRPGTRIPPGDVVVPVERLLARIGRRGGPEHVSVPAEPVAPLAARWYGIYASSRPTDRLLRFEIGLTRWEIAALLLVLVVTALFAMTWMGSA